MSSLERPAGAEYAREKRVNGRGRESGVLDRRASRGRESGVAALDDARRVAEARTDATTRAAISTRGLQAEFECGNTNLTFAQSTSLLNRGKPNIRRLESRLVPNSKMKVKSHLLREALSSLIQPTLERTAWRCLSKALPDFLPSHAHVAVRYFDRVRPKPRSLTVLCRNLVSSLLEREQIKTTLPKAKEAARMAEQVLGQRKLRAQSAQWTLAADINIREEGHPARTAESCCLSPCELKSSTPGQHCPADMSTHRIQTKPYLCYSAITQIATGTGPAAIHVYTSSVTDKATTHPMLSWSFATIRAISSSKSSLDPSAARQFRDG